MLPSQIHAGRCAFPFCASSAYTFFPAIQNADVDLSKTYTPEFVDKAKG